jgi:hypothetical protein
MVAVGEGERRGCGECAFLGVGGGDIRDFTGSCWTGGELACSMVDANFTVVGLGVCVGLFVGAGVEARALVGSSDCCCFVQWMAKLCSQQQQGTRPGLRNMMHVPRVCRRLTGIFPMASMQASRHA